MVCQTVLAVLGGLFSLQGLAFLGILLLFGLKQGFGSGALETGAMGLVCIAIAAAAFTAMSKVEEARWAQWICFALCFAVSLLAAYIIWNSCCNLQSTVVHGEEGWTGLIGLILLLPSAGGVFAATVTLRRPLLGIMNDIAQT